MSQNKSNSDKNPKMPKNSDNTPNPSSQNYSGNYGSHLPQGEPAPLDPSHSYYPQQQGYYPPPQYPQGQPSIPANKNPQAQPKKNQKKAAKPKKHGNGKWVWLGILIMLVLIAAGGVIGYQTGIQARQNSYKEQSIKAAAQQYNLAIADIQNGKYENAKTRLDYVLSVDPNYPGATEKYTEVVVALYPKETPTPFYTPTPAPTSTPDTRGEEELLNTIRANMAAQQWETAIANIEALRNKNLSYKSIEVDGMYYIALRNYGIQLINSGYLESGIYKITLAEAFGPIDALASNQRDAARSYLAGAGFWEIDWAKALEYYSNAYLTAPGMYDRASGYTAQERYIQASFEYANRLVQTGDYCSSIEYYNQAFSMSANEQYAPTATAAYLECYPPTATPEVEVQIQQPTEMLFTPTVPGMSGGESGQVEIPAEDLTEPITEPETVP